MKKRLATAAVAAFAACLLFALCGCTEPYDPSASMKDPAVEESALLEAGVLKVGVDASSYPLAGQANGRMSGLEVDVAAAVAQELGLKVDYVDVGTDGVAAVKGGEVDVAVGVEAGSAGDVWVSDAYAPSCVAVFSMDEAAAVPEKDAKPVIAAQTSSLSAWLITRQFGNSALSAGDDLKAVFQDLQDGNVAYAAADAVVGRYVMNTMGIDGHIVALMQPIDGYCMGVKSDNKALQTAITQALSTIGGNGVLSVVDAKWTGGSIELAKVPYTASAKAEAKKDGAKSTVNFVVATAQNEG